MTPYIEKNPNSNLFPSDIFRMLREGEGQLEVSLHLPQNNGGRTVDGLCKYVKRVNKYGRRFDVLTLRYYRAPSDALAQVDFSPRELASLDVSDGNGNYKRKYIRTSK